MLLFFVSKKALFRAELLFHGWNCLYLFVHLGIMCCFFLYFHGSSQQIFFCQMFGLKFFTKKHCFPGNMGVSKNNGFSPHIIKFNRVFHYKPSILGYPYFWKHPHLGSNFKSSLDFLYDTVKMRTWGKKSFRKSQSSYGRTGFWWHCHHHQNESIMNHLLSCMVHFCSSKTIMYHHQQQQQQHVWINMYETHRQHVWTIIIIIIIIIIMHARIIIHHQNSSKAPGYDPLKIFPHRIWYKTSALSARS